MATITYSFSGTRGPAGAGFPPGGAAGQLLVKQSGTDFDADWATPAVVRNAINVQRVVHVRDYGAVGDGVTDDTAAIQAAIDATPVGGLLEADGLTYLISDTLVIDKPMAVRGVGSFPNYGTYHPDGSVIPTESPYVSGTVFLMGTAATDGMLISLDGGQCVHLSHFAIRFADAIRFTDTGHGIVCSPSGAADSVLFGAQWDSVMVYGHDGDHYAFDLTNIAYCQFNNLQGWGGGMMRIRTTYAQCGNSTAVNVYGCLCVDGTANGYDLRGVGAGQVLLMQFIRPQIFFHTGVPGSPADPAGGQYLWYCDDVVFYLTATGIDLEAQSGTTAGVRLPTNRNQIALWVPAYVSASGAGAQSYIGSALSVGGGAAGVYWRDRANQANQWVWWAQSGIAYFGSPTNVTAMQVDTSGNLTLPSVTQTSSPRCTFAARPNSGGSNQSIPGSSTTTIIALATEDVDRASAFASNAFTAPVAGDYRFEAATSYISIPTSQRIQIHLYKNGAEVWMQEVRSAGATFTPVQLTCVLTLAPGDVVDLRTTHSHSSAVEISRLAAQTRFSGSIVR